MDENKRDDLVSEETEAEIAEAVSEEGTVPEEASGEKELETELEELRDMFQQELDKAAAEAENQTEQLIQELDDTSEEELTEETQEPVGRPCEICGENPCAEEYGEDYPYCEECRNIMKKYPLRASGIIMTIIMIAVFIASAVAGTSYAESFMRISEYAAYYDTGKLMTALNGYYSYVNSSDPSTISMKAVKDSIEGFVKIGYISDAATLIQTIYSEDQLKLPWNKKYAKIIKDAETLTESYYTITEIITPVLNGEEDDFDKVMAELDALYELKDEEGNPVEINGVFVEYYRYVAMSVLGSTSEELLAQLGKTAEKDTDGSFTWAYLSNYAAMAAKCGGLELTEELCNKMLDISVEDTNAYVALANYYRYADTPDPDKMLEICEQAKENAAAGDYGYMPAQAVAYLLKGEGAVALDTMDGYISMSGYTVQACNLYALCALYNGNEEIYNEMKTVLERSGYEISEAVEQYKNDKISIEEILTDKEGKI
ncbi:MAG: hypothetical protein J6Q79_00700 [Clostridia bacterium]|nr:hypothetical protein [Clostridia bacterium]